MVRNEDPVEDRENLLLLFAGDTARLLTENVQKKYTPEELIKKWNAVCAPYNDIVVTEFKAFKPR